MQVRGLDEMILVLVAVARNIRIVTVEDYKSRIYHIKRGCVKTTHPLFCIMVSFVFLISSLSCPFLEGTDTAEIFLKIVAREDIYSPFTP